MRKAQWRKVAQFVRESRHRRVWNKIVQAMACVVVFCTTYALILPAITVEKTYFCGMEAHTHAAECYGQETSRELVCQQPEVMPHIHGEGCLDDSGALLCTEEVMIHQHGEECYHVENQEVLLCELPEHIHEPACSADLNADLETAEDWEATLNSVVLTGNWEEDLAAIAASQIGYRESEQNYLAYEGENHKGYTRYGAWYGIPYEEWDAMFASFCLRYAEIPKEAIPWGSDSRQWLEVLRQNPLTGTVLDKVPESGDLLFYSQKDSDQVRVAIVAAMESQKLRLTEGGRDDQVTQ